MIVYNNKFIYPIVMTVLMVLINYSESFEIYYLKYNNLYCGEVPLYFIASTRCSNFGYIQVASDNRIAITTVNNTLKDCTKDKEIQEFVELHHCYLNRDGTSYKYILNEKTSPTLLEDFCNEAHIIDCNNNFIKSFKNNTCIRENFNGVFTRYECSSKKDTISVYRCTGNCNDTNCVIQDSYGSNVSKCEEIQPNYTPFPQTHHSSSYNESMSIGSPNSLSSSNSNSSLPINRSQTSDTPNNLLNIKSRIILIISVLIITLF